MPVVCTMAAAAVCVWPYREAGSVPAQKTKYWTQLTTPAAKVSSNLNVLYVRVWVRHGIQTGRGFISGMLDKMSQDV